MSNLFNNEYSRLLRVSQYFSSLSEHKRQDFSKTVIIACQHILEPQKVLFEKIISLGFLPENIFLLGKAYSTNSSVLDEIKSSGIYVVQPPYDANRSFDEQHSENCRNLLEVSEQKRENAQNLIVLDDGGALLGVVHLLNLSVTAGVEQTSSGFRRLEGQEISFPIFNVARSRIKLELETPHIVALGIRRVEEKIKEYSIENPHILVVGLGSIGEEMVRAANVKGFNVSSYDKIHGLKDISKIIEEGINVVIGTTGSQIISHDELLSLNDSAIQKILFVSMSSSDREFELWKLRNIFTKDNGLHDDLLFRKIIIANNGFPITFKGNRQEALPEEMDRTMSLLLSGVVLGALKHEVLSGFVDFPDNVLGLIA